jgi:putative ABC transport system ATP-binding protein
MKTIVRLSAIQKHYRLGNVLVPALHSVDLDVAAGEFLALAGPSGSGKTTLLNLIGCVDKPDAGSIEIDGVDVTSVAMHRLASLRRDRIGYIFQTFNLIPVLSAFENVEYPLLLRNVGRKARERAVTKWLEHVGLADHAGQRPDQLSGGQRQRVAIARALVSDPALILADEPTANLDSETGAQILDLLREINRESRRTFIFATHDLALMNRASRVVRLRDGRIAADLATRELEKEIA